MPPEVKEAAPKKMSFEKGLVSDVGTLNGNALVNKHNFMDSGENALAGGAADREDVAVGVRNTLRARMAQENRLSAEEAAEMARQHQDHKNNQMLPAAALAKRKIRESRIRYGEYLLARSRMSVADANAMVATIDNLIASAQNEDADELRRLKVRIQAHQAEDPGFLKRVFGRYEGKTNSALATYQKSRVEANNAVSQIASLNESWNNYLADYKRNTFKPRYRAYDKLMANYYMMSREKTEDQLKTGFERPDAANPAPQEVVAKNISEYIGVYNIENINNFANDARNNPYNDSNFEFSVSRALNENSNNVLEGMVKRHTMAKFEAFAAGINNLGDEQEGNAPRRIVKIDNNFKGYLARHQVGPGGVMVENEVNKDERQAMNAFNLVADERASNGSLLFSQKSSKIYTAKSKRTGNRVRGFFINDEFFSENKDDILDQSQTTYFGTPNWKKTNEQERLRRAIRRSDFFKHVNSASIQYYLNYNENPGVVQDQHVKRSFMSRREGVFSFTNLGQSLLDGSLIDTLGGITSAALGDSKNLPGVNKELMDKQYVKYIGTTSSLMEFDKKYGFGIAGGISAAALPVMAMLGDATLGVSISNVINTVILMIKNIYNAIESLGKLRKIKPGDDKWPHISKIIDNVLGFISGGADILDSLKWIPDPVKGIVSIVKDLFGVLKDAISVIASWGSLNRLGSSSERINTAMQTAKRVIVNPSNEERDAQQLGNAANQNSQAAFYLRLAKQKSGREIPNSVIDGIAKGLNITGTTMGLGEKMSWFNPISFPFKLAGKVTSFLGKIVNAAIGKGLRKSNVGYVLGDSGLDSVSGFNDILKEETGINNKHYLAPLMRVFMAVDTHALLMNSKASPNEGDRRLAEEVVSTFFKRNEGETYNQFVQRVSFKKLLDSVGAPSDWRNVLLESIS